MGNPGTHWAPPPHSIVCFNKSPTFSLNRTFRCFSCWSPWLAVTSVELASVRNKNTSEFFQSPSQKPGEGYAFCRLVPTCVWARGWRWSCQLGMALKFKSHKLRYKVVFLRKIKREGSNVEMTVQLGLACFPICCLHFCQEFSPEILYVTNWDIYKVFRGP